MILVHFEGKIEERVAECWIAEDERKRWRSGKRINTKKKMTED